MTLNMWSQLITLILYDPSNIRNARSLWCFDVFRNISEKPLSYTNRSKKVRFATKVRWLQGASWYINFCTLHYNLARFYDAVGYNNTKTNSHGRHLKTAWIGNVQQHVEAISKGPIRLWNNWSATVHRIFKARCRIILVELACWNILNIYCNCCFDNLLKKIMQLLFSWNG